MATAETLNVAGTPPAPTAPQKSPGKPGKAQAGREEPEAQEVRDKSGHLLNAGRETEIQWFRVTKDVEVPNRTGKFMLKRGKVLSTKEYSLQELKDAGVELEACEEPAWHRRLQKTGESFAR